MATLYIRFSEFALTGKPYIETEGPGGYLHVSLPQDTDFRTHGSQKSHGHRCSGNYPVFLDLTRCHRLRYHMMIHIPLLRGCLSEASTSVPVFNRSPLFPEMLSSPPSVMNLFLGPIQLGYSLATFLFGLMTFQIYSYFRKFPNDPSYVKILVITLWASELGHHISLSHGIFYYTVTQFSNSRVLLAPVPPGFPLCLIFHGLTTLAVSWFFIIRLWTAAEEFLMSAFLALVMLARSILVIIVAGNAFHGKDALQFFSDNGPLLTASLATVTAGEILVTTSLCYDLSMQRQTHIYRMWTFIDRFIMWSIATGVVTSVIVLVMFICYMTMRSNLIWLGIFLPLSRFFAISLLTSLNARNYQPPLLDSSAAQKTVEDDDPRQEKFFDPNIEAAVRVIVTEETLRPWNGDLHGIRL